MNLEHNEGYSPRTIARMETEHAARDYCAITGHRTHLLGHSRNHGAYIETQDPAGQWRTFWQELRQDPTE